MNVKAISCMSNTVQQRPQVYEHVYETVDINSSPEVRANATAKVNPYHSLLVTNKHMILQTLLQSTSLLMVLRSACIFKSSETLCAFSGNRGSFCCKRRTFASSSCRTAQDRRRSWFQHNGWQGAKLAHLHLTDHPGRHR